MGDFLHKDIEKILVSQNEIENIVNTLANQLEKDYNYKEFIMIGLLKGSMVFLADLMRKIKLDFAIDFMVASSYGSGTESSGKVLISKDISVPIDNKDILIVEDIVDSGITLDYISKHLYSKGAKSVAICTLFDKPARRIKNIDITYKGMTVPDEFVVGYGLDYNEKYRNLPYVGILKSSVYSDNM
ncbi:MAG: hypoxanthine phosphoribosyltransferase [Ruminococcus sp.]|nr:hypoxanthine phosphoribosyltransferase [Ruminococcus sp.]